jgi:tRNA (cytidine/uridine-2'-O-)-methyltransferase
VIEVTAPPERIGGTEGLHVVLVQPLIPPNTGNVARLCAATGAWLHLVEPLGFDLDHRKLKRAGLDYWPSVRLSVHSSVAAFLERLDRASAFFFTKFAERLYTAVMYPSDPVLIFGQETRGLGQELREQYPDRQVQIPISNDVRSLNLSNAAAVAVYEVVRQRSNPADG